MRNLLNCGVLAAALSLAHAATLQQLSLDDMIQKSTAIVRGSVQLTGGAVHGRYIYTHYTVHVVEQWKGATATQIDFAVPGGTANGLTQSIPGAPSFTNGQEYVLYLWTSRSGLTQVIGLSQGLFVSSNGMVVRPAITDHMIDPHGAEASDPGMQMTLGDMRNRIVAVLKGRS
jgi:hypothetical protein